MAKSGKYDLVVVKNLISVFPVDLEVKPDSTVEEAIEVFFAEQDKQAIKYRKNAKSNLQTTELYRYRTAQEAIDAVKDIDQVVDLKSEKTSLKEAVEFCKKIMLIISKCGFYFIKEEREAFVKALAERGVCAYSQADPKFKTSNNKDMFALMDTKDNIEFPLTVFSNFMTGTPAGFLQGLQAAANDEYSRAAQWLKTQNKTKRNEIEC